MPHRSHATLRLLILFIATCLLITHVPAAEPTFSFTVLEIPDIPPGASSAARVLYDL